VSDGARDHWRPTPNVRVWSQGREYVEAAEILLYYNRILPAAVVAGLAIEIFVKSFLATRLVTGHAKTVHGHELVDLYQRITPEFRDEILDCSREIDPLVPFEQQLQKHDGVFAGARYIYEPTARLSVGSDTVHFSRHVCDTVFLMGHKRGV
jgi:hypothetical protein